MINRGESKRRTTFFMNEDLFFKIKEYSQSTGRTMTSMYNKWITEGFEKEIGENKQE